MEKYILKDLTPIENSIKKFIDWWPCNNEFPCRGDGSMEDLEALGFCSYEISFPDPSDFKITSIFWTNIIKKNTDLTWGYDGTEYFLFSFGCYPRYCLYPRIRIMEVMNSSVNQFEGFEVLTQRIFFEMLSAQYEPEELPDFTRLFLANEKEFDSGPNFIKTIDYFKEDIEKLR